MRDFYLTAKPGCNVHHAVENPDYTVSEILEVDHDGTILGRLPYLSDTEFMYKPKPDPEYSKPQKVVTPEGEVEIPRYVPEDKVTDGENPFVQHIYRYVKRENGATEEDIIRYMTKEKKYIIGTKYGLKRLKQYILEMHKGKTLSGLLIFRNGEYLAGVKLEAGKRLLDSPSGYDPFEYHIMRLAESKGILSRDEIHRLMTDRYKWARKSKTVEYYIYKLLKMKYIRQVHTNWFEYKRFLDTNEVLAKKLKQEDINSM